MSNLVPEGIVKELDRFVIGQNQAKRAVAVALRNRWRRQNVAEPLQSEITPKNILMIGPTGVGKTEIARRLARLADAPFIKVEATKFTEVGYVGRDVDSIVRDLIDTAVKEMRVVERKKNTKQAEKAAEERILDVLLPGSEVDLFEADTAPNPTRENLRKRLDSGALDEREIEISLNAPSSRLEVMAPPGMDEMADQLKDMFSQMRNQKQVERKLKIKEARKLLIEEESENLINEEELKLNAVHKVEQNGIVFLDEIDKVATRSSNQGADVSRAGVQRDLLPLVEGTTVVTKYGPIKTDHILFIASGAFHVSKPSDLIPELQGRFPIRVELNALSVEDFVCILKATDSCLINQYRALLATEEVALNFSEDGIAHIAEIAFQINDRHENIGARRLYTVMEKLLEDISFNARAGITLNIDKAYVDAQLKEVVSDQDLTRYVL